MKQFIVTIADDSIAEEAIESCAEYVKNTQGTFEIRRAAEWGGGVVATVRDGQLTLI